MAFIKSESTAGAALSRLFIDKYMCPADGSFVKVYIWAMSRCGSTQSPTNSETAAAVGLLESDVVRAWRYWESVGAVKLETLPNGEFNIEFLNVDEVKQKINLETKPVYTQEEIAGSISQNYDLSWLYNAAGKILNKTLSYNDTQMLYSFYDFYGLPAEVIQLIISYMAQKGKKYMYQIEKEVIKWVENGIDTYERAEAYLKQIQEYDVKIQSVKSALGIYNRKLTPTETKYINRWLNEMHHSPELIACAFDIAVNNTGKFSVKYMDTILQDWFGAGIKTPKSAAEYRNKRTAQQPKARPSGFNNFIQPDYDFAAMEAKALGINRKADNK